MPRIGLQLYTLRAEAATDLAGTLSRVGRFGFEGVELFALDGVEAAELRRLLDVNGLAIAGRHASLADVEDRLDELAAELGTLGTDRLTLAWIDPPESAADLCCGPKCQGEQVARLHADVPPRTGDEIPF